MGTDQAAGKRRRRWRWLLWTPLVLLTFSVLQVAVLRFVDPPASMVMVADQIGRWSHGPDRSLLAYRWVDTEQMAACLPVSLVAAEDQQFPFHRGFDLDAIAKARDHNARGGRVRGASTIFPVSTKRM
mgnify:FL=1